MKHANVSIWAPEAFTVMSQTFPPPCTASNDRSNLQMAGEQRHAADKQVFIAKLKPWSQIGYNNNTSGGSMNCW